MPPVIELPKKLTYQDCQNKIGTIPINSGLKETELFIDGDHWQDRSGWVGWKPESTSDSARNTWAFIETSFNAENIIGGMVTRIVGAVLGKSPDTKVIPRKIEGEEPNETETKEWKEIDDAMNHWWDNKGIHEVLKTFIHNRTAYGKASLRIHIPIGYLEENGDSEPILKAKNLADMLDKIYLTAHHYSSVIDGVDVNYGEQYAIVKVEGNEDENGLKPEEVYEIYYVNKEKKSVIRILDGESIIEKEFDLGGNSLTYVDGEYKKALISPTIKKQQKAVNHAKTGENYALANINFPETTFIDVDLPTEKKVLAGKKSDVVVLPSGLGIFRQLFSKLYNTADGGQAPTYGQMIQRTGADPKHFATVAENNKRSMHQEGSMLYIYLADSEYASGESKMASMTDYVILLTDEETIAANAGVWLFETVLRLAFRFIGKTELNNKFRVIFTPKLTVGLLSVEERTLMLDEVNNNLRSRRNYRLVAKVTDDPNAEEITIIKEQKERPNVNIQLAEIAKPLPPSNNPPTPKPEPKPAPKPPKK